MNYVCQKLGNHKVLVFLIAFSTIAYSAFGLAMPHYSKYVVDGIAGQYLTISRILAIGIAIVAWVQLPGG